MIKYPQELDEELSNKLSEIARNVKQKLKADLGNKLVLFSKSDCIVEIATIFIERNQQNAVNVITDHVINKKRFKYSGGRSQ